MKCPKCNYVSHDYLDACRKCGIDLVAFKHEIGLLVLQPGVLDLSLVLAGAGADDFFESVEEEVIMHASDDDDFDISLDDYVDQPTLKNPLAIAPRGGGPAGNGGGLDHLTLELDAADLPAELATRLRASQALPDLSAMLPPRLPGKVPGEEEDTLPGHMTLEMRRDSLSGELPPEMLDDTARVAALPEPPAPGFTASQDALKISQALGLGAGISAAAAAAVALTQNAAAAPTAPAASEPIHLSSTDIDLTPAAPGEDAAAEEEGSDAPTVVNISGPMPSLQLQDVSLDDEMGADVDLVASAGIDPNIPTIQLLDVDTTVAHMAAERRDEPPEVANAPSAMLDSFALTVDNSVFAMGGSLANLGEVQEGLQAELDTELDLDLDLTMPPAALEETAFAVDPEMSLSDVEGSALEASALTLADEDRYASLRPGEWPPVESMPPMETSLAASGMFDLEDLADDAMVPGHLTLELQAPELLSPMLADAGLEAFPESPTFPAERPRTTEGQRPASAEDIEPPADTGSGPVTLELDLSELPDLASLTLEELQLEEPPGELRSAAAPASGERQLHEEELLLDLDDFEFADEDDEQI